MNSQISPTPVDDVEPAVVPAPCYPSTDTTLVSYGYGVTGGSLPYGTTHSVGAEQPAPPQG